MRIWRLCWRRLTKPGVICLWRIGWRDLQPPADRRVAGVTTSIGSVCGLVGTGATERGSFRQAVKIALAEANREYERRFSHIFIVCATGKSGPEILEILRRRLHNDKASELHEAAEQQRQIMHIRLTRWLSR